MSDEQQHGREPEEARQPGMGEEPAPDEQAPPRPARWRRRVRGKSGVALVGVLAGALLGAGTVAWQTDILFPAKDDIDMCWGSLPEGVAAGMFPGGELRTEELSLGEDSERVGRVRGECRITRYEDGYPKGKVVAKVRDLDDPDGLDAREWPREFLSPQMAALRGEPTGMASSERAWVALPRGCAASGAGRAPTVVDLSTGSAYLKIENDDKYRAAMARAVVHLANGVMEELDCSGAYKISDSLPPPSKPREASRDALCGVEGLRLPEWAKRYRSQWVTPGEEHGVRSCEVGEHADRGEVRLTTVEDADLARIFSDLTLNAGDGLRGDGYGRLQGDMGVYTLQCQTGNVAFVADQHSSDRPWARKLLPAYVKAEAKRIGCGDVKVKLPD